MFQFFLLSDKGSMSHARWIIAFVCVYHSMLRTFVLKPIIGFHLGAIIIAFARHCWLLSLFARISFVDLCHNCSPSSRRGADWKAFGLRSGDWVFKPPWDGPKKNMSLLCFFSWWWVPSESKGSGATSIIKCPSLCFLTGILQTESNFWFRISYECESGQSDASDPHFSIFHIL